MKQQHLQSLVNGDSKVIFGKILFSWAANFPQHLFITRSFLRWEIMVELFALSLLAYGGWAIGVEHRIFLQAIDAEDISDLAFSSTMAFSGYYGCKFLLLYQKNRFGYMKTSVFFKYAALTILLVLSWETAVFWTYATFYYKVPLKETSFYISDIPFIMLALIGFVAYFNKKYFEKITTTLEDTFTGNGTNTEIEPSFLRSILVTKGKTKLLIPQQDFAFFISKEKLLWLYTWQGDKYLIDGSLQELDVRLEPVLFFRINRQVIISRTLVQGYRSIENQKLLLYSTHPLLLADWCIISKYTSPSFKAWVDQPVKAATEYRL